MLSHRHIASALCWSMLILLFNAYLPENMLYMKEYIKKEKKDIEIKEKKKKTNALGQIRKEGVHLYYCWFGFFNLL